MTQPHSRAMPSATHRAERTVRLPVLAGSIVNGMIRQSGSNEMRIKVKAIMRMYDKNPQRWMLLCSDIMMMRMSSHRHYMTR